MKCASVASCPAPLQPMRSSKAPQPRKLCLYAAPPFDPFVNGETSAAPFHGRRFYNMCRRR